MPETNSSFSKQFEGSRETLSTINQKLIDRIKAKVSDGKTITYMQEKHGMNAKLKAPVTLEEVDLAEEKLGYRLPPLIREVYLQVGNGGFGPGYGIAKLSSLVDSLKNLDELKVHLRDTLNDREKYKDHSEDDHKNYEDAKQDYENWNQSERFASYCDWGCSVWTVVDLSQKHMLIYSSDGLILKKHSSQTLQQWWYDWLDDDIDMY